MMRDFPATFKKSAGLTLIEVLVALAIVAIAMTAIIKAVSQNIRSISHLQEKTIAHWVGNYVLNQARLGLIALPKTDNLEAKTEMLNQMWFWRVKEQSTPNPRIKKISVSVYSHEISDGVSPSIMIEGYHYAEE